MFARNALTGGPSTSRSTTRIARSILLVDHSFGKPVASKLEGTLKFVSTEKALEFTAALPPASKQPSWVKDAVLSTRAGLTRGVSPGFIVPPANVVANAETLIPEPGNPGVLIRVLRHVVLFEMSLVTRPSYKDSMVELRAEDFTVAEVPEMLDVPVIQPDPLEGAYRWL